MISQFQIRRNAMGFTLIELLVVVVVIGLLIGLSIPAISQALMLSKRTACASNMRQIGMAMTLYANENEGWLPTSSHTSASQSWIFQLQDYMGGSFDKARLCPSDPKREQRKQARGSSYVLNEFTSLDVTDPFGNLIEASHRNLLRMARPSQTIVLFTVSDRVGVSAVNDHTHSRNWSKGWKSVLADIQPDRHRSGGATADHTKGSANYLFADGRVENILAAKLKQQVDSGINPARPPL